MAARGESGVRGPDQPVWLAWLTRERDNIQAALAWCTQNAGSDIFCQRKKLKCPSEKLGMQQRLQGPSSPRFRADVKLFRQQSRNDSGQEVVLIGKSGHGEAIRFRPLGQARPIDVGGNVGLANAVER